MNFNIFTLVALSLFSLAVLGQTFNYNDLGRSWVTSTECNGLRQSPINIDTSKLTKENKDIKITATGIDITSGSIVGTNVNELKVTTSNGQIAYRSDSEQTTWDLAQFHFHAPSEHTIDGTQYAL